MISAIVMLLRYIFCVLLCCVAAAAQDVQFSRDVRPILSDRCFFCHGPDSKNNSTPLRLDTAEGASVALMSGGRAVVPGDPDASALIERVTSDDPVRRMPPSYAGHAKLSDEEISTLRSWVEQGAEWKGHWAFEKPEKLTAPSAAADNGWVRSPIDSFVVQRLAQDGLEPAPEGPKETLIRRASLDLTGLPPTPSEVDAFLADDSEGSYERVVDRLLTSDRYGERMAYRWLDAARYADTNGYQNDEERDMWRWRDWVIDAFNRNQPFDEFTIEQIAGDLLPNPTVDQLIATGFNRNHRGNGELGIVPEEYHVEYVVDRVDTTATVWLGLTMGCARCHDHKYDPISQKDFYSFYAFFNNIPDRGRYFKYGNTPPVVAAPTRIQKEELAALDDKIAEIQSLIDDRMDGVAREVERWDAEGSEWEFVRRLVLRRFVGEPELFDGERLEELANDTNFDFFDPYTLAVRIKPDQATGGLIGRYKPSASVRGNRGFGFFLVDGKLQLRMESVDIDDRMIVETLEEIPLNEWSHVAASYDGSRLAKGMKIYVDGMPVPLKTIIDHSNNNTIEREEPLRFGYGPTVDDRFEGQMRDARVYNRALSDREIAVVAVEETVAGIARLPRSTRSAPQSDKLRWAYLAENASPLVRENWARLQDLRLEREDLHRSFPTVMVMREMETPREAHVLLRGVYDAPGEAVEAAMPTAFQPPQKGDRVPNRLDLANWIVSSNNPLTARVTVNRFWQMLFGTGIVKTVEDFGSQGEWPTHPELIDWLAVEFVESGWDVKALMKTILMSATYRQDSAATSEKLEKDPENRLLSRGPRVRLPAESIRDQALAVAGLLHEELGGPSVKPYQPAGLWTELSNWKAYEHDKDEGLYRRSLYTFWKRTIAPPSMLAFDAAPRETCIVRETRTNTPLQALDLMNDVAYVEAARVMAARMMHEGGEGAFERLEYGFRLVTSRRPTDSEIEVLLRSFRRYLDRYQSEPDQALVYVAAGERVRDETLDVSEHAAYAATASLMLNLDETITSP